MKRIYFKPEIKFVPFVTAQFIAASSLGDGGKLGVTNQGSGSQLSRSSSGGGFDEDL